MFITQSRPIPLVPLEPDLGGQERGRERVSEREGGRGRKARDQREGVKDKDERQTDRERERERERESKSVCPFFSIPTYTGISQPWHLYLMFLIKSVWAQRAPLQIISHSLIIAQSSLMRFKHSVPTVTSQ